MADREERREEEEEVRRVASEAVAAEEEESKQEEEPVDAAAENADHGLSLPLSEEELEEGVKRVREHHEGWDQLKKENELLRQTLAAMRRHEPSSGGSPLGRSPSSMSASQELKASLSTTDGTRDFYRQMQAHVESPQFLAALEQGRSAVLVNADTEHEVGFVDLEEVEWWTLVPDPESERRAEEQSLSGPYVFVERSDVVEAIGLFVANYMTRLPATQQLSPQELQRVLSGTFAEFQEKGVTDNLWRWGRLLYATYGWGMTGISLYRDPSMALMVMRAVWSACKWACWLVVA